MKIIVNEVKGFKKLIEKEIIQQNKDFSKSIHKELFKTFRQNTSKAVNLVKSYYQIQAKPQNKTKWRNQRRDFTFIGSMKGTTNKGQPANFYNVILPKIKTLQKQGFNASTAWNRSVNSYKKANGVNNYNSLLWAFQEYKNRKNEGNYYLKKQGEFIEKAMQNTDGAQLAKLYKTNRNHWG